jgi:hypothetical protein
MNLFLEKPKKFYQKLRNQEIDILMMLLITTIGFKTCHFRKKLEQESQLVKADSMEVLKDFENIEDAD